MGLKDLWIYKVGRRMKQVGYEEPHRRIHQAVLRLRERLFVKSYADFDFHQIPIIINNYNRLEYPLQLIEALELLGYRNLYIIDNKSTYPPLLEYYDRCPYRVFRLDENVGHLSLWKTGIYKKFRNQWFIYTDSDIVPGRNCPADFAERLYRLAMKYGALKVGFALHIDDLPDCYENKNRVVAWERLFWENPVEPDVYEAEIDTTFALYRPNIQQRGIDHGLNLRVGGDMAAHHLPWYVDSAHPSEEELNYIRTCNASASWAMSGTPQDPTNYIIK